MIAVSETANALGPLRVCSRLEPSWNGRQRVIALDGPVMSVQPDGSVQWRLPGTDGQWEGAALDSRGWLVYHSGMPNAPAYAFAFFQDVPA